MSDIQANDPVVKVRNLKKIYKLPRESLFQPAPTLTAVSDVSLEIARGKSFGVVGESGSGKSTLARLVMALDTFDSGSIEILGHDLAKMSTSAVNALRPHFQIVFQDPYGSLDPRHKVARIVGEPLDVISGTAGGAERDKLIASAIEAVGLRATDLNKFPHEFSGGQRQRIAIARAIVTRPDLIVADEAVSALDVSVQAQILNLLKDLQDQFNLTYLFISHDLSVVEFICDEVAVMYSGRIMEMGPTETLFNNPRHGYTKLLLDAVPRIAGQDDGKRFGGGKRPDEKDLARPLVEVEPGHFAAI